ncbi:hypothetical protein IWX62_002612 [Arthrobacter sp. CAN_A1]
MSVITIVAVGALAAGPAAANAVTNSGPESAVYVAAASGGTSTAVGVSPNVPAAAINAGRALYAGFKAGTSPREVGRVLGWGSFLASSPVENPKSFNQDQAFDR